MTNFAKWEQGQVRDVQRKKRSVEGKITAHIGSLYYSLHFYGLSLCLHMYSVNHNHVHSTTTSGHRVILCIDLLQGHIWTPLPQSPQDLPDDKPYPAVPFPLWEVHFALTLMSVAYICCFSVNQSKLQVPALPKRLGHSISLDARNTCCGEEWHLSCLIHSLRIRLGT